MELIPILLNHSPDLRLLLNLIINIFSDVFHVIDHVQLHFGLFDLELADQWWLGLVELLEQFVSLIFGNFLEFFHHFDELGLENG